MELLLDLELFDNLFYGTANHNPNAVRRNPRPVTTKTGVGKTNPSSPVEKINASNTRMLGEKEGDCRHYKLHGLTI
jgi:hypothetical protein